MPHVLVIVGWQSLREADEKPTRRTTVPEREVLRSVGRKRGDCPRRRADGVDISVPRKLSCVGRTRGVAAKPLESIEVA